MKNSNFNGIKIKRNTNLQELKIKKLKEKIEKISTYKI